MYDQLSRPGDGCRYPTECNRLDNVNAPHPNSSFRGSTRHFAITAVALGVLAFVAARLDANTGSALVAASIAVIAWIALSDLRPQWLKRIHIPVLDLKRLVIVTVTTGIGAGLGLPTVNGSKDLRVRSQSSEALHDSKGN